MKKAENMEEVYLFLEKNIPGYCDYGIYGIDIARSMKGDLHIIEINRTPGIENVLDVTGTDFLYEANRILFKRARKHH